ncbi:ribonucleases P/MRP protein subunit POP1-like [Aristolochia californica]|uniref:ribonucleases P/MRP protein subunit POP1-like n=1 Tax=Aristolochia californica TaxID=171875 RepID=UPI0035DB8046
MVLVPFPLSEEYSQAVLRGVCYGNAMLHHVGAPHSHLIAPVIYMWRPSYQETTDSEVGIVPTRCNSVRQLWVWLHAAAFHEGFNALRYACEKLMNEENVSVSCFSRGGELAKLEVMGSKASEILLKILHPLSEVSSASADLGLKRCSVIKNEITGPLKSTFFLLHSAEFLSNSILSLAVQDPRDLEEDNLMEHATPTSGPSSIRAESFKSLWLKPDIDPVQLSDSKDLWTLHGQVNLPLEESLLCQEKHKKRLAFFHLDDATTGKSTTECEKHSAQSCPILLLKSNIEGSSLSRWSIILPVSWVKAFWIPLITKGAHAIGQRERHWIASSAGIPSFPYDFPDSRAYLDLMAAQAAAHDQKAELCPLAVRPLRVPIPPPWHCIKLAALEWPRIQGELTCNSETANGSLLEQEDVGVSFQGFVARRSTELISFLNEICGNHLVLFPHIPNERSICSVFLNKGRISPVPIETRELPTDRKLCFLRILLHAYKKGVFEDGAVVCAPVLTDLSQSTSRWDEEKVLQIPPSSVRTYFMQKPSGKWELQIPEDPVARQSNRWPIGFVTSGFVRGSTKPVALALCEATLLARLRQEQWGEMQENGRPEIFVLVRNLRSSAYRLALASIVLEDQEADAIFL